MTHGNQRRWLQIASLSMASIVSIAIARPPAASHLADGRNFSDAMSSEERARIESELTSSKERLKSAGLLDEQNASGTMETEGLQWPLQPTEMFIGYHYYHTGNFVDHAAHGFKDYTCHNRTYDGHQGSDYGLNPYSWLMMDQEQVAIVAAAPGTIIDKADGNLDRNCAMDFSKRWNAVYVQHADGSVAWYGHMKLGSTTSKPIGSHVNTGDVLGFVGSSGASTGPHLHFELHDSSGAIVDPYHGYCNSGPDLWAISQPYEDPMIDSLSTHSQIPDFVGCGVDSTGKMIHEDPHYSDVFVAGDTLYVGVSYRDQRAGEASHFEIVSPDGDISDSWDYDLAESGPDAFHSTSMFTWPTQLPKNAPTGTWQAKATFHGQTYTHEFMVSDTTFQIGHGMTGLWYNPGESGHGFSVEVLAGNQLLAEWYTFAPDGGQVWIIGSGPITGNTAVLEGYFPVGAGGRFPPNFDAHQLHNQPWGTITFAFTDCNNGQVRWEPTAAGYASGAMPITRLTTPAGLACP